MIKVFIVLVVDTFGCGNELVTIEKTERIKSVHFFL